MHAQNLNENTQNYGKNPSQLSLAGNRVLQNSRTQLNTINDDLRQSIDVYKDKIERERQLKAQMDEQEGANYDKRKLDELQNTIFYDAEDNDVNRRANKVYANATKVVFSGSGTVNEDKEVENLRKYQQSLAHHTALTRQVEEKRRRIEAEKEKEREMEEIERKALERIRRRQEMEEKKKDQVRSNVQHEMNTLSTNHLTQNEPQRAVSDPAQSHLSVNSTNQFNYLNAINKFNSMQSQPADNGVATNVPPNYSQQPAQISPQNYQTATIPYPPNAQMMAAPPQRQDFSEQYNFRPDQASMPHMEHFKQKEVFDDRFYVDDLVKEIRERLSSEINFKMQQFHEEMLNSSNMIKREILNLRDVALKVNQEKNQIDTEIKGLRHQVLDLHHEDEVRTNELMKALTSEDNYKILPTDTFYRDSGGRIKDVNKIDDDYIQYMDYLAHGTGNRNLKEQRRFIPLAEYEDLHTDEYYGQRDREYETMLDYNSRLSNHYNF